MKAYDFAAPRGALALAALAVAVATMAMLVLLPATAKQYSAERMGATCERRISGFAVPACDVLE